MKTFFLAIVVLFVLFGCDKNETYEIVISDVGFFDGEKDHGIVNIGINADTIAIISEKGLKSDSTIVGSGKYLIPGLVNSHCHIWTPEQLKEGYDVGILANMGLHSSMVSRDSVLKVYSKKEGYPFFYTSGFAATVPYGHPTQVSSNPIETINDSVSTKDFIDHRIEEGVDYIKIVRDGNPFFEYPPMPTLSYDSIKSLIDYAHEKDLKAVVHIGSLTEMVEVAKLKPDGFVHVWSLSSDSDLTDERLKIIKNSGAFIIPTAILAEKGALELKQENPERQQWGKENFLSLDSTMAIIKELHNSGIMIVAGTDNGNFDLNWGDDLLEELRIYKDSGMTTIEVLQTATGNASKAWNIPIGKLTIGSKLNMVLLNENPIDNLAALENIDRIWKTN